MKRIMLVALMVVTMMAVVGCTRPEKATQVLEAQGFTDIQITGYNFFGCSEQDTYHTGFIAKGQNGSTVEGVVCEGLFFKGATVRF